MAIHQPHIVIVGGAYGGLSTLNSLISLGNGQGHLEGKKRPGGPGGNRGGGAPQAGASSPRAGPPPGPPNVSRGLRVKPRYTLLDERDGFYHLVGAPLGQISPSHAREFWVKYDELMSTKYANDLVHFVRGSASRMDVEAKTLTYRSANQTDEQKLSYDFLVIASGLNRGWPVVPKSLNFGKYVADAEGFEKELSPCSRIVLVGGGEA
jgi:NADH dehydrogenase FAD-containing subunit